MSKRHLDGVFADTQGVPQLDGLVPGARHDLAVISREGHAQYVLGVSNEAASRGSPRKRDTGVKTGGRIANGKKTPKLRSTLSAQTLSSSSSATNCWYHSYKLRA